MWISNIIQLKDCFCHLDFDLMSFDSYLTAAANILQAMCWLLFQSFFPSLKI